MLLKPKNLCRLWESNVISRYYSLDQLQSLNNSKLNAFYPPLYNYEKELIFREMLPIKSKESILEKSKFVNNYDLTVFQWNILAESLCKDYPAACPSCLEWDYRKSLIIQEIVKNKPDMICLEEVDHYSEFSYEINRIMKSYYTGFFMQKLEWHRDGLGFFFDSSKYNIVDIEEHEFQLYGGHKQNQIYLLILLKSIEQSINSQLNNDLYILMGLTHLRAYEKYEHIRIAQTTQFLEQISKMIERNANSLGFQDDSGKSPPIILTGDFNDEPRSPTYNQLKESKFNISSVYEDYENKEEPKYTSFSVRNKGMKSHCFDYIWYSNEYFVPQQRLSIPSKLQIGKDGLPSPVYPSDHFALTSKFNNLERKEQYAIQLLNPKNTELDIHWFHLLRNEIIILNALKHSQIIELYVLGEKALLQKPAGVIEQVIISFTIKKGLAD